MQEEITNKTIALSVKTGKMSGKALQAAMLNSIKKEFTGVTWFVEGDIRGCFDNINHHVLVDIIGRKDADNSQR